jgi:phage gp36-like protein
VAVYATSDDLASMIGAATLSSLATVDGFVDDTKVANALANASGIADGYIMRSYPAGVTVVPLMLKQAVLQIANYILRVADQQTEDSRNAYAEAIKSLTDVGNGTAILPGQPTGDDGVIDPGDPLIVSGARVWDRRVAGRLF